MEASVDGQPVADRRRQAARAAGDAGAARGHGGLDRAADRRAVGRGAAGDRAKLVQLYVSQLRKALADSGDGKEIVTRGHGYELRLGPASVDAGASSGWSPTGEPREALALWRGPPLDDVAGEPFAGAEIRRLEELRLDGGRARDRARPRRRPPPRGGRRARGAGGRGAAARAAARPAHARAVPLRPPGRRARRLPRGASGARRAIGVEPGPELRRLHEAILRQDPALDAAPAVELPPELDTRHAAGRARGRARRACASTGARARGGAGRLVLSRARAGSGRRASAAELAAEVHRDGGAVLYAAGADAPEAARVDRAAPGGAAAGAAGARRRRPAPGEPATALRELAGGWPRGRCSWSRPRTPQRRGRRATLTLAPLDADGVRARSARPYARRADAERPVERLAAGAAACPRRVHRARAEWARDDAARRARRERRPRGGRARRAAGGRGRARRRASSSSRRRAARRAGAGARRSSPARSRAWRRSTSTTPTFFFGRERLVAEMVARLAGAPLLGVVGPSGSGKSSALRAGPAAPRWRRGVLPGSERWALALLRPGEHPLRRSSRRRADARRRPAASSPSTSSRRCSPPAATRPSARRSPTRSSPRARDPRRRALVLIAVRADFYGRCAAYPELCAAARRQPRAGRADAPRRAAPRDRAARAARRAAGRARARRRAGRGRRGRAGRAAAAVDRAARAVAAARRAAAAPGRLRARRRRARRGRAAGRARLRAARRPSSATWRGGSCCGWRARARATPSCAAACRSPSSSDDGASRGARRARRRAPGDDRRGRGRGRARGAAARVAAPARLARGGRRGPPAAPPPRRRRARVGRRGARPGRALPRRPAGRGARLGRRARRASSTRSSARSSTRAARAERARAAPPARACSRASPRCSRSRSSPALVALEQRGSARDAATAADAQRLGARALAEDDLDRSLLLARQGVALDDTPADARQPAGRADKSPAAIGVLRGAGEGFTGLALSPDGRTLGHGRLHRQPLPLRHPHAAPRAGALRARGRVVDWHARVQPRQPPARHRA